MITIRRALAPVALSTGLLFAGCASGGGGLGDILGGVLNAPSGQPASGEIAGEIQANDPQQGMLQIKTSNGQTGVVRYDAGTKLYYQNQEASPAGLERGDLVEMRVQETTDGALYTDYIVVTKSVQERTGQTSGNTTVTPGLTELAGTITWIDHDTGRMQVRTQSNLTVTVSVPYNPRANVADRFHRLRVSDYVRLEGRYLTQDRFEIERFL